MPPLSVRSHAIAGLRRGGLCRLRAHPEAGDGIEQCDDGDDDNNDTCRDATCSDGYTQASVEECDDGNLNDNDACTAECDEAECGDGIVEFGVEDCDDGDDDNTDTCDTCDTCDSATCGDMHVWAGREQCDDGNPDKTDDCTDSYCGDGILHSGIEQCDLGDDNGTSSLIGCTDNCIAPASHFELVMRMDASGNVLDGSFTDAHERVVNGAECKVRWDGRVHQVHHVEHSLGDIPSQGVVTSGDWGGSESVSLSESESLSLSLSVSVSSLSLSGHAASNRSSGMRSIGSPGRTSSTKLARLRHWR